MLTRITYTNSVVDWGETFAIFNNQLQYVIGETSDNNYHCSRNENSEISEGIKKHYLDDVFQRIDNFKFTRYGYDFNMGSEIGDSKKDIISKQWSNGNTRIQLLYFLDKEKSDYDTEYYTAARGKSCGFVIIYGDASTYLIVGCHNRCSFVYHPSFTFNDDRKIVFENPSCTFHGMDELKEVFKIKALKYIFDRPY